MSWQDVAALAIGAVAFAAYLHYIHGVYQRDLIDGLERDYYTRYDISVRETAPEGEGGPELFDRFETHDPGDEQPQR